MGRKVYWRLQSPVIDMDQTLLRRLGTKFGSLATFSSGFWWLCGAVVRLWRLVSSLSAGQGGENRYFFNGGKLLILVRYRTFVRATGNWTTALPPPHLLFLLCQLAGLLECATAFVARLPRSPLVSSSENWLLGHSNPRPYRPLGRSDRIAVGHKSTFFSRINHLP